MARQLESILITDLEFVFTLDFVTVNSRAVSSTCNE